MLNFLPYYWPFRGCLAGCCLLAFVTFLELPSVNAMPRPDRYLTLDLLEVNQSPMAW